MNQQKALSFLSNNWKLFEIVASFADNWKSFPSDFPRFYFTRKLFWMWKLSWKANKIFSSVRKVEERIPSSQVFLSKFNSYNDFLTTFMLLWRSLLPVSFSHDNIELHNNNPKLSFSFFLEKLSCKFYAYPQPKAFRVRVENLEKRRILASVSLTTISPHHWKAWKVNLMLKLTGKLSKTWERLENGKQHVNWIS